ncbi:MAG: riboflavin synthase [Thermaerobacter sp.]|nr:riboflavin synthase [Thermaerobacter sp.]
MFTGIIESTGVMQSRTPLGDGVSETLLIAAPFCEQLVSGESVSVNGVCLTVTGIGSRQFEAVVSPTTLRLTTLGGIETGRSVNLERSVTPATRLGGHWVLGHVDGTGRIAQIEPEGEVRHVTISFDRGFAPYVLPLGSITVDGISLTVVATEPGWLTVTIIPHTLAHTTLGEAIAGQAVNLEFDVLGKYVQHLLAPYATPNHLHQEGVSHHGP